MTRKEKDRQRYLEHREERLRRQHEYYIIHREEILFKKHNGLIR